MFCTLHWQFAAHYLKSSVLFKVTITTQDENTDESIKEKKKWLKFIEIAFYCILVSCTVVLCFATDSNYWLVWFEVYWVLAELIMTTVTLLSMRRIHESSKSLEEMGINKSSTIMLLYIALWISGTVFTLVTISLNLYWQQNWPATTKEDI